MNRATTPSSPRDGKLCSTDEAVALIKDGDTVACGGFVGAAHPEGLTAAMERRFLAHQSPKNLTLLYAAGQGDAKARGLNHLAHEGLVRRVVGGHWSLAPRLGKLALTNKIEAYNFPQGVLCQLFRDIAAGRPGCITHIGLGTFIDPAVGDGGRVNERTTEPLVERIELGGRPWLWYKSIPINISLIRATAADPAGNLIMDQEVMIGEVLSLAQAAHNCGGLVLAQVKQLRNEPIPPQQVSVPGILVDRIILAQEHEHEQTFAESFNPAYVRPMSGPTMPDPAPMEHDERWIIAARACDELEPGMIINLGIGMPEGVARVACQRGILDTCTLTVESGPIGGMPAGGLSFGASVHPLAVVDQPAQFDFYDGRGLDFTALGLAQTDGAGNVNVSRFGDRFAGVGGFVNISQTAKRLVFCGTFTAGGLKVRIGDGQLEIVQEGKTRKFLSNVEQISFSAARSRELGQRVLYVTERAVFGLSDEGLELIEIAPGIDLQRHILDQMDFVPIMRQIKPMSPSLFT
ncbi:MAG: acyl CoA:acetate/3-ketoacid CoA transferase [Phycisphaerales bacterium]|nr:acyl CoA:acetate/3-ketoacid CoA transferase [Phycisphaerales bacterium]